MLQGHPQICLFQPEIPQNAGNIGRLAAGSGCRLHLVKPFGFSPSDKNLRRAGLDYWPFLDLEIHNNLEELLDLFGDKKSQVAFLSKRGPRPYTEIPPSVDLLVFGRETSGLPEELHHKYADSFYHIPMFHPGVRSLNLANTVSVVVYSHIHRRQEAALL